MDVRVHCSGPNQEVRHYVADNPLGGYVDLIEEIEFDRRRSSEKAWMEPHQANLQFIAGKLGVPVESLNVIMVAGTSPRR